MRRAGGAVFGEETMLGRYAGARVFGAAAALLMSITVAAAQQPGRIRGEVVKADGAMLAVKTRDGAMLNVKIADDTRVTALVQATLADIKPDTFVGIAGVPQPDGSIQAFSIHIPPPALRGNGEGMRPWDARPGSTMTNAFVESLVTAANGGTLTVKYKNEEKKVLITPQTAIAAAAKADKSELKPGAQIIIFGWQKQDDGSILAKSMYVGRGLVPAM
jgi:hypothetical protein